MNTELGRELTTAEAIAVTTGKLTIMDILHGAALDIDSARDAEIHTVMPSGLVITRGALWREMHAPRQTMRVAHEYIIGVNASANMFA